MRQPSAQGGTDNIDHFFSFDAAAIWARVLDTSTPVRPYGAILKLPLLARQTVFTAQVLAERRETKHRDKDVRKELGLIFPENPLQTKLGIFDNKYVDLETINAYRFSAGAPISAADSVPSALGNFSVHASDAKRPLCTAIDWIYPWRLASSCILTYYPERAGELSRYYEWVSMRFNRDESQALVYIRVEEEFRRGLKKSGGRHTLDDVSFRWTKLVVQDSVHHSRRQQSSSAPGNSSSSPSKQQQPKKKPTAVEVAQQICKRWNADRAEPPRCAKGGPPCQRRHVCSGCSGVHLDADLP